MTVEVMSTLAGLLMARSVEQARHRHHHRRDAAAAAVAANAGVEVAALDYARMRT